MSDVRNPQNTRATSSVTTAFAFAVLLLTLTGCSISGVQAQMTTPPAPPVIQVKTSDQQATITWQPVSPAKGYQVAWINVDQMQDAISSGADWTERLSYTNLPAERTSHIVAPLQPGTPHAFIVGAKHLDGASFAWSQWFFTSTQPDPCPCNEPAGGDAQTRPDLDIHEFHPLAPHLALAKLAVAEHHPQVAEEPEKLTLTGYEAVTWPNGAMGCEQEGYFYTTALVDGYVMTFRFRNLTFAVHVAEQPLRAFVPVNCV